MMPTTTSDDSPRTAAECARNQRRTADSRRGVELEIELENCVGHLTP